LLRNITRVVHETTGAPLDKITVYVQEVAPADWADAGSIGSEKDFAQASRRQQYPVNQTAE
jgi:4-oxalocrotonate tautomerase